MPRLGWTMETGTIVEWLKNDGDPVEAGDIIFTVETDKAVHEVEALDSGILRVAPDSAPTGVPIAVGTVLAHVQGPGDAEIAPSPASPKPVITVAEGTAPPVTGASPELGLDRPPSLIPSAAPTTTGVAARPSVPARSPDSGPPHGQTAEPVASPRARRVARELGLEWRAATGTGSTGRIVALDVRALAEQAAVTSRARVTPLARRLAEDSGVDLDELAATMPGQRIVRAHVQMAATESRVAVSLDGSRTPLGHVRRITAQRMTQGAQTTAPVTLTTEADATELVRLRTRLKEALAGSARPVPSYNDLLVRLVSLALLEHPALNRSWADDALIQHEAAHIGLAVETERGLFVPVVRDAHLKSLQQIAAESAALIEVTRAGKAGAEDLRGSTFTITNLGMYDIDAFTPIINLPECAILGIGRIVARPVVIDEVTEQVAVRRMMALSLTFDHRVVDGAPAARFLRQVKHWIEQPYIWLTA